MTKQTKDPCVSFDGLNLDHLPDLIKATEQLLFNLKSKSYVLGKYPLKSGIDDDSLTKAEKRWGLLQKYFDACVATYRSPERKYFPKVVLKQEKQAFQRIYAKLQEISQQVDTLMRA